MSIKDVAQTLYQEIRHVYPIFMTRNLTKAKEWVVSKAKGSERYGLSASSSSKRLKADGVFVQCKIDSKMWFLNDKEDVRSSCFLEDTATEFDIQGLELDYSIVCFDANLRFEEGDFKYYDFKGTKWNNINKDEKKIYLKNSYRVLMTRARQRFIIYIPNGDIKDETRNPSLYDGTYNYFKEIGIAEI